MENYLKISLALLLFACLLDMPYGYYQLVRFLSMGAFCYLGFKEFENANQTIGYFYFGLAILFQPFIKVALGREIWNFVDVIVGVMLIGSIFFRKNKY